MALAEAGQRRRGFLYRDRAIGYAGKPGTTPLELAAAKGHTAAAAALVAGAAAGPELAAVATAAAASAVAPFSSAGLQPELLTVLLQAGADPLQPPASERGGASGQPPAPAPRFRSCLGHLASSMRRSQANAALPEERQQTRSLLGGAAPGTARACLQAATDACLSRALAAALTPSQRLVLAQALALLGREQQALQAVQPMLAGVLQVGVGASRGGTGSTASTSACKQSTTC